MILFSWLQEYITQVGLWQKTRIYSERKGKSASTFKAQNVTTFNFSSSEKKCILSKQGTGQMAKPGNSGGWGFLSKYHSLPKPEDVTGNAKRERARKKTGELPNFLALMRVLWYRVHGQPATGRAPGAPRTNLGKGSYQNLSEDGHWTPVKPTWRLTDLGGASTNSPQSRGRHRKVSEETGKNVSSS